MSATVIDGKAAAAAVISRVRERVEALKARGVVPGLAVVLAGDDPASQVYVRNKIKKCAELGIDSRRIDLPGDVSMDEIMDAARDAMATEFIEDYDDNYEHQAAIHGANFSGGQKQRLLIARALAAKPAVLILDDSSSALDYRTDAQLRNNIKKHFDDTTTVVIAQRVSSIMSLDQIIMMDEGRIIGIGTHEELLSSVPQYREIYETQMGEV